MEFAAINSPTAAFVAGLVTSLHCAGMCGPLACTLMPVKGDRTDAHLISSVYHLTRLTSYALLGGLAGGLGRLPLQWLNSDFLRWLPWVLVVFFLGLALRWDRYLPKFAFLSRLMLRVNPWLRSRSKIQSAAALGFATPLLPCGPLYFLIGLALLSGSALRGVEFMLAFGLGTVPLLWLAQSQFHWLRNRLSPLWLDRARITLALTTALIIGWRLRGTLGFAGPDVNNLVCF
ncbi:MAG: sulfite exporter TauE/SafE family protein [Cephaloticoccus sp.]|nr:sulfite exporter TauE/SafE family protein [Cephaloticoccus sp.]MCF7760909.1 sulfite exporter TauE/SafE family protein [Cephaloticoccus sp.]